MIIDGKILPRQIQKQHVLPRKKPRELQALSGGFLSQAHVPAHAQKRLEV